MEWQVNNDKTPKNKRLVIWVNSQAHSFANGLNVGKMIVSEKDGGYYFNIDAGGLIPNSDVEYYLDTTTPNSRKLAADELGIGLIMQGIILTQKSTAK